jgi:hypothetical protein
MALATRPKPKAHHHKRQAHHHKRSKQYLKPYWPYLPMLVIVGLGLLVNSALTGRAVLGAGSDFSSISLLKDTNAQRATADEAPLTLNPELQKAAQAKAEDMVRSNYWAHNSPDGKTPWTFITESGYSYQSAGENLAYGFAGAADSVAGWMNSPEHRANILDSAYSEVGFGVARSADYVGHGPQTIVVAEYGQPAGAAAPAGKPSGSPLAETAFGTDAQPVSRVQLMNGNYWSLLTVVVLSGFAGALFVLRHSYRLHRALTRGEAFVTRHPYLDISVVFIITAGAVLTRISGVVL